MKVQVKMAMGGGWYGHPVLRAQHSRESAVALIGTTPTVEDQEEPAYSFHRGEIVEVREWVPGRVYADAPAL